MNPGKLLRTRYLHLLLSSRRGRAFVLTQAAEAEASDEAAIFDRVLAHVDDAELGKMIRKHKADEERHARMFLACAERTGVDIELIPQDLMLIHRLDRALGDQIDRDICDRKGVMQAYVLLQVIEERAVTQFAFIEPVLRAYDPASADVLRVVTRDEERHLKYCRAISRRYAPDAATLARTLACYRDIELLVFAEHTRANLRYTLDHELLNARPWQRAVWRGISRLRPDPHRMHRTPFWDPAAAASLA